PLETGDTLLVITAFNNLEYLKSTRDFVLTDSPTENAPVDEGVKAPSKHVWLSWGALISVVMVATLTDILNSWFPWIPQVPIHYASLVGALALLWLKVVTPREAYASV